MHNGNSGLQDKETKVKSELEEKYAAVEAAI